MVWTGRDHGLNLPHLIPSFTLFSRHIELPSALSIHHTPSFSKSFTQAVLLLLGTSFTLPPLPLHQHTYTVWGYMEPNYHFFLRFAMRSSFLLAPLIEHALLCGSVLNWNQYFIHSLMSASPYSESSMKVETTSVLLTTMF